MIPASAGTRVEGDGVVPDGEAGTGPALPSAGHRGGSAVDPCRPRRARRPPPAPGRRSPAPELRRMSRVRGAASGRQHRRTFAARIRRPARGRRGEGFEGREKGTCFVGGLAFVRPQVSTGGQRRPTTRSPRTSRTATPDPSIRNRSNSGVVMNGGEARKPWLKSGRPVRLREARVFAVNNSGNQAPCAPASARSGTRRRRG